MCVQNEIGLFAVSSAGARITQYFDARARTQVNTFALNEFSWMGLHAQYFFCYFVLFDEQTD